MVGRNPGPLAFDNSSICFIGLWRSRPLSTIIQLYRESFFLVEETGVPVASHRQTLSHSDISSTSRHEQGSNSQQ